MTEETPEETPVNTTGAGSPAGVPDVLLSPVDDGAIYDAAPALETDAPAADEAVITAAEDPPYVDVVSVRHDGRTAVLTVNGNETVLNAHDCQSLWRELSAIVPVI